VHVSRPDKAPTIRANLLASLAAEVVRRGGDADRLLRAHIEGLEPIRDPYQEAPLGAYVAFFEAASDAVADPLLGARMGARFQPEELGPLGVVFVAAPSLRAALNRLGFFLRAWQGGTSATLEIGRETAEWSYRIDDPGIWPRRQDAEFTLSATCSFIRTLLGPGWAPVEVQFEHPPGEGARARRAIEATFGSPVLFDQGLNRIVFDKRDLDRPTFGVRQAIAPYLEQHLRDLMGPKAAAPRCAEQVGRLIAQRMGRKPLDVDSLAGALGLSRRTLQRRLKQEGASLRGLIQAHRLRLAEPALERGHEPIGEIASLLGYADPTVFSRAFKTWRGSSPRAYQRRADRSNR
jgi:AraC-like DNA-binding protein